MTVLDVLGFSPFLEADWELLTPEADLSRPVRWIHAIGAPRPATLLQGHEFVLSTLPVFTEEQPDLMTTLRGYLDDLDAVGAAALAVEIFVDRPRLREGLRSLVSERQSGVANTLPIVLFNEEVRFVEITEQFHRHLVTLQSAHDVTKKSHDPLFDAATQLIGDALGGRIDTVEEARNRAQLLGIAESTEYRSLLLRFRTPAHLSVAELVHAQELVAQAVRSVASHLQAGAVVGETPSKDVGIILTLPAHREDVSESTFCLALKSALGDVRAPDVVPAFVMASGEPSPTVLDAIQQLETAQHVHRSLEIITPSNEQSPGWGDAAAGRGYWNTTDLGLLGILARLDDQDAVSWFTSTQLSRLRGENASELRDLIRVLVCHTGTKADMARQLGISRPTLYARISRLERMCDQPLNGDLLIALYIALLLEELHR